MTRIAVKRPVTTFMVILIFLAVGLLSLTNLEMALLPNMNLPYAAVVTSYQGVAPDQMQKLVTEPVEDAMARLSGLSSMTSMSMENVSYVILEFDQDVDIDMVSLDIREAVDRMKSSLPDDASDPMVIKADTTAMASIYIAVSSQTDDLVGLKTKVDDEIADRLARQNGVASVDIYGGREKEIRIDLLEDRIRGYGIAESTISAVIAAENTTMPVGTVDEAGKSLTIKVDGEFTDIEQIKNLPLTTATGGTVYMRDVADINEVYKDISSYAFLNNEPGLVMSISKQSSANDVNMSNAVMKELDRVIAEYPELEIKVIVNTADYITDSLNSVVNTAISGVILAIIVLFVFLRNFKATLVVGAAIPLSIMVTFAFMYFYGMTVNLMSLGGLVLGVGMLVDNSIVVLESVFRRMEEGESKTRAAINGAREVAMSIVASTLTTVAVFLPVAWMSGLISQIFNDLALSISFALAASLLVALTFVPLACSLFLTPSEEGKYNFILIRFFRKILDLLGRGIDGIAKGYGVALRWCTTHKAISIILSILLFVGSMSSLIGVGLELIPAADQSQIDIDISLPSGAVLDRTLAITQQALERVEGITEIEDILTSVSPGSGSVTIALVPMSERVRTSTEIADDIRNRVRDIAGAEFTVEASTSMMGGGMGMGSGSGDVSFTIKGDSIDELQEVAADLISILEGVDGLRDVSSNIADTSSQVTVKVDRMKAASFGLSASGVMSTVSTTVYGNTATTFKQDGTELDVRITQADGKIQSLDDLETLLIPTQTGAFIPLREVADITVAETPLTITREDQQTIVRVYGSLDGSKDLGTASRDARRTIESQYIMPQGITLETTGTSQTMDDEFANLILAFLMGIFIVYAIMAAEFESMYYPMIIMLAVPTAMSFGILGLFVMGQSLGITAALGLIMLLGIVVNNGIVLIDYINLMRGKGMDLLEAVQTAGPVRLRAILMTTLTTCLGLVPMMLGTQEGSEMMQPLATVVVWGLALSTLITLFLVPVLYTTFETIRAKFSRGKKKRKFRQIEEM